MEEENKKEFKNRTHKIEVGDKVKIWRKDWNDKVFYSVMVTQKQQDGTSLNWYRPVVFRKGVEIENGTTIIINKMFESLRVNKRDQYNPISSYVILDFNVVFDEEQNLNDALNEYEEQTEINDSDLPF